MLTSFEIYSRFNICHFNELFRAVTHSVPSSNVFGKYSANP